MQCRSLRRIDIFDQCRHHVHIRFEQFQHDPSLLQCANKKELSKQIFILKIKKWVTCATKSMYLILLLIYNEYYISSSVFKVDIEITVELRVSYEADIDCSYKCIYLLCCIDISSFFNQIFNNILMTFSTCTK